MLTLLNRGFPMLDDLFDEWSLGTAQGAPYDLEETEGHFLISMDVPGVPKDKIQLEVKDRLLRVNGERRGRRWSRAFTLPQGVDGEKIEASVEDGVLRIAVPKAEVAKPLTIKIQDGRPGVFQKLLSGAASEKSA